MFRYYPEAHVPCDGAGGVHVSKETSLAQLLFGRTSANKKETKLENLSRVNPCQNFFVKMTEMNLRRGKLVASDINVRRYWVKQTEYTSLSAIKERITEFRAGPRSTAERPTREVMIEVFKDQRSGTTEEDLREAISNVLNCKLDGVQIINYEAAKWVEKARFVAPCKVIIEITDEAIKESDVERDLEYSREDVGLALTNQRTPITAKVTMLKLKITTEKQPLGIKKSFPACVMIVGDDMKKADFGVNLKEIEIVVLGFEAHEMTTVTGALRKMWTTIKGHCKHDEKTRGEWEKVVKFYQSTDRYREVKTEQVREIIDQPPAGADLSIVEVAFGMAPLISVKPSTIPGGEGAGHSRIALTVEFKFDGNPGTRLRDDIIKFYEKLVEEMSKCLGGTKIKMVARDISRPEWIQKSIEPVFSKCGIHFKVDERSNPKHPRNDRKEINPNPSPLSPRRHPVKIMMGRLSKDAMLVGIQKALEAEGMDNVIIISALREEFGSDEGFFKPLTIYKVTFHPKEGKEAIEILAGTGFTCTVPIKMTEVRDPKATLRVPKRTLKTAGQGAKYNLLKDMVLEWKAALEEREKGRGAFYKSWHQKEDGTYEEKATPAHEILARPPTREIKIYSSDVCKVWEKAPIQESINHIVAPAPMDWAWTEANKKRKAHWNYKAESQARKIAEAQEKKTRPNENLKSHQVCARRLTLTPLANVRDDKATNDMREEQNAAERKKATEGQEAFQAACNKFQQDQARQKDLMVNFRGEMRQTHNGLVLIGGTLPSAAGRDSRGRRKAQEGKLRGHRVLIRVGGTPRCGRRHDTRDPDHLLQRRRDPDGGHHRLHQERRGHDVQDEERESAGLPDPGQARGRTPEVYIGEQSLCT